MQNRQSRCTFALDMFQNIFAFILEIFIIFVKCHDFLIKTIIITGVKEDICLKSQLALFYHVGQKC